MTPEGAERLARRLHRYHLDDSGGPFVEHLGRVAELVREAGGGAREVMAAWLHGTPRSGLQAADLVMRGVPSAVIRIVEAVAQDPGELLEPAARRAAAVRAAPGAALVLQAVIRDRHRPGVKIAPFGAHLAHRDRDLLAACGLPVPAQLAPSPGPAPEAAPVPRPDTAALLRQLDGDHPNRWEAARMLAEAGELGAVRPLVDAYVAARAGDPRWADGESRDLRGDSVKSWLWKIIRPMRGSADPAAVQVFAEIAAHQDDFIRGEGIRGLAGARACLPLIEEALLDDSSWVAGMAAEALPDDRVAAMADRLVALARRPGFRFERDLALQKLAAAGDPRVRELLLADLRIIGKSRRDPGLMEMLVKDDHPLVVPALISHLGNEKHPTIIAARILGAKRSRDGGPAIATALRAALPDDGDPEVALACVRALAKIQDPATIPAVGEACRHRRYFIKDTALQALFWSDDPQVTDIALAAAGDFSPKVRDRAVRLLAARGDQRATTRLISACDGPLRHVALRGLIRLADERAVPALIRVLRTSTDQQALHLAGRAIVASARTPLRYSLWSGWKPSLPQLREAIWVLAELGEASEISYPEQFLQHWDEVVRARTVAGMGKSGNPAPPALTAALTDISPRVRASTATALAAIASSQPRELSGSATWSIRHYKTHTYITAGQAREWLNPLRDDPHPSVPAAASAALRRLR
ncbi:MAG: HEAT repeat domain-containing protein [Trebonia sp.]